MKVRFFAIFALMAVVFLGACGGASDADLQAAADKALKDNESTKTVTVAVKDKVATVSGKVADADAQSKAAELAKVDGVTEVKNEVEVEAPAPTPEASGNDSEVKEKIEAAFKKAGCDGATVEVKDGTATITGKVKSAKYAECVMAVNTAKPKNIDNKLEKE